MKVLILGGVAAGTKAAAKLKREDRSAQVTLITKIADISYAGCGLPYYVGGVIEERGDLIVNTPEKYAALTGVTVYTLREACLLYTSIKRLDRRHYSIVFRQEKQERKNYPAEFLNFACFQERSLRACPEAGCSRAF